MCSGTECLEMVIILHICLFLMSNDSGDISFGKIETILYCTISIARCNGTLTYLWVNLIFICIIHLMVCVFDD